MTKDEAIKMGLDLCKERLGIDGSAIIPELITSIYDTIGQAEKPKYRDVIASDLVEGRIYETYHNGPCRYSGLDHYMGQTTYKFVRMKYTGAYYCLMDCLSKFLCQIEDK